MIQSKKEEQYNKAIKGHYKNDPDRVAYDRAINREDRAEATGYYAGKIVSGYIIGSIIGLILALWFIWYMIIDPWVIPIIKIFLNPTK